MTELRCSIRSRSTPLRRRPNSLDVARGMSCPRRNDEFEVASAPAHEMGHVVARHAAIREEQAKQAALVGRVVSGAARRPDGGRAGACPNRSSRWRASRARRSRWTPSASGSHRAPAMIPTGLCVFSPRWRHNSELWPPEQTAAAIGTACPDFRCRRTRQRRSEFRTRSPTRANIAARRPRPAASVGADKTAYLGDIDGVVFGEDPSEGLVRGRRFFHSRLGFTFTAPEGFNLENSGQAVLGVKHGGSQALRLDLVRGAGRANACGLPNLGLGSRVSNRARWRTSRSTAFRPPPPR